MDRFVLYAGGEVPNLHPIKKITQPAAPSAALETEQMSMQFDRLIKFILHISH